ncbi:MAG: hypothetical protein R3236_12025, partial [Phycisphaeraceae bacterium]|nr:hypothetical protein [Phycisphaeraceae bacterium]
ERGGTLIVIAGAGHMPHRYLEGPLTDLLPVTYTATDKAQFHGPEPAFQIALAPEGRDHLLMQQNNDPVLSQRVWKSLPPIYWRHPIERAKPGATVLAYAVPLTEAEALARSSGQAEPVSSSEAERAAFEHALRAREQALIVTQSVGAGKVMMLNTDRTWRLRYREGDTFHHKFWGQVLRWGTHDKLRDGNQQVRLGSDRIRYTAEQDVIVKAQLLDENRKPVKAEDVAVHLFSATSRIKTIKMDYVPDSNGRYIANAGPMPGPGTYRLELTGPTVGKLLVGKEPVRTELLVAPGARTTELVELDADHSLPTQMARLSRGRVVEPVQAASILDLFGPSNRQKTDRVDESIWDAWYMILLIILVASAEWLIRKKVGLT